MTPEQEEQVRRALRAAAQADEPLRMPPEVASRLDEVLADLAGPRGDVAAAGDEVTERRKRRWPNLVVAAAAVAVIAAAGGAVATGGFGTLGGAGDSTTAEHAASSKANDSDAGPSTAPSSGGGRGLAEKSAGQGALPLLRSSTLSTDVRALLRAQRVVGGPKAPRAKADAPADCARPFTGRGASLFVVRLDGRPATLVVGPAQDGQRQARIYSCDGAGSPLASVSVPTR